MRHGPPRDRAPQFQLQQPPRCLPGLPGVGISPGVPGRSGRARPIEVVGRRGRRALAPVVRKRERPRGRRGGGPRFPLPTQAGRPAKPIESWPAEKFRAFWDGEPGGPFRGLPPCSIGPTRRPGRGPPQVARGVPRGGHLLGLPGAVGSGPSGRGPRRREGPSRSSSR